MSIVYPFDDKGLAPELKRLDKLLPESCELVVGGRAARAYNDALEEVGARQIFDLGELKVWLDSMRDGSKSK